MHPVRTCFIALVLLASGCAVSGDEPLCTHDTAFVDVVAVDADTGDSVQMEWLTVSIDGGEFETVPCDAGSCDQIRVLDAEGEIVLNANGNGWTETFTLTNEADADGCFENPEVTFSFDPPEDGCRDDGSRCD